MKRLDPSAIRVIDDNHACVAGTFTYDLDERCTFSRSRLKTLVEAIHRIAAQRSRGLDLDSVTATKLFDLYEMVVRCSLLAHFDPQDGARIEKLPPEDVATGTTISTSFTTRSGATCQGH